MQEAFGYLQAAAEVRAAAQVRAGAHASATGRAPAAERTLAEGTLAARNVPGSRREAIARKGSATKGSDPFSPSRAFYRTPIFWLAVALLAASIAGCIVTVLLALGQPDGALPDVGERLLSVPAAHAEMGR